MTYLSTAEVAEIKGCSLRYVQQLVQNGKLMGETKDNAANNRTEYMIPLTALPQDLQLKWENQQRRSLGLEPVKKAIKAPLKAESTRLTLDDLTGKQRSELYLWTRIIKDWLTIRDSYEQYSKGEIDETMIQGVKDCLDARELIKLKVLESSMYNAREASVKLAEATGADCVQVIGSKFVLYLQKKKDSAYADLLK